MRETSLILSRRGLIAAGAFALAGCAEAPVASAVGSDGIIAARPSPPVQVGARSGVFNLDGHAMAFIPPALDRARLAPMILLLHGAGGKGENILRRFMPMAEARGVILLAPQSQRETWDGIRTMYRGDAPQFGPDVQRIDAAMAALFAEVNVDPRRLAIGGFSDGASYALSLGLRNTDLFRSIIAMSAGGIAPFTGQPHARVFISHGRKDSVLDYDNTAKGIVPGLKALGLGVTFISFDGDHELREPEMKAAFDWFLQG